MLLLLPSTAWAGMPSFVLTDLAELRLEAISFFAFTLLFVALGLQQLWNRLTELPALSYRRALGLTLLWGLLFHLVLTMISGARELMTPGAWVRKDATYVLVRDEERLVDTLLRQRELLELHAALGAWSAAHDGALPPHAFVADMPSAAWRDAEGRIFEYHPDQRLDGPASLLAWEPADVREPRLALFSDGTVGPLPEGVR